MASTSEFPLESALPITTRSGNGSRFSGENPSAHKGLGYSCLTSSTPLTENVKNK